MDRDSFQTPKTLAQGAPVKPPFGSLLTQAGLFGLALDFFGSGVQRDAKTHFVDFFGVSVLECGAGMGVSIVALSMWGATRLLPCGGGGLAPTGIDD